MCMECKLHVVNVRLYFFAFDPKNMGHIGPSVYRYTACRACGSQRLVIWQAIPMVGFNRYPTHTKTRIRVHIQFGLHAWYRFDLGL